MYYNTSKPKALSEERLSKFETLKFVSLLANLSETSTVSSTINIEYMIRI